MKRLHRYLLAELLRNGLLTLGIVLFIFFLIALALIISRPRVEGIPFHIVVEHTAYNSFSTLYLTLPMTVLTACLFTYGRLRADGEFTAIRIAGIHPWHVISPALVFGAAVTLGLAILQDQAMPSATLRGRQELTRDLASNIEGILIRSSNIVERHWKARWERRGEDEEGKLVLFDLELLEFEKSGKAKAHTVARLAKPILDRVNQELVWELSDFVRVSAKEGTAAARTFCVLLPLDALSTSQFATRRDRDRNYGELILRADRKAEHARLTPPGRDRRKLEEDARESQSSYHFRIAFAFSSILFSLFGASLGLLRGLNNRIVVFIIGFLVIVALYYPLQMCGTLLGEQGVLPPRYSMWIGNVVVGFLGITQFWRVRKA